MGKMGPLTELEREATDFILDSSQNILELVNSLLEIGKLKSGALPFLVKRVNIRTLINKIGEISRKSVEQKGLKFIVEADEFEVFVDAEKIERVYFNLISNAVKFTDQGHIRIFALKVNRGAREYFYGGVEDTGQGILEDNLKDVFNEYYQIKAGEKRGTGLGLAIAREIIEKHGGVIGVESELNKGSLFYFYIPLEERKIEKLVGDGRRILVISSDTNTINVITAVLKEYSFAVESLNLEGDVTKIKTRDFDGGIIDCVGVSVSDVKQLYKQLTKHDFEIRKYIIVVNPPLTEEKVRHYSIFKNFEILSSDEVSVEKLVRTFIKKD